MLRIEENLDHKVFSSNNSNLERYVDHHRLLVPSIAAYDIHSREASESTLAERYTKVVSGLKRSATLCLALHNLENAAETDDWQSIKLFTGINKDTTGEWRFKRDHNSDHAQYHEFGVWTAKRSLVDINEDVSIRERYTIAAHKSETVNTIEDMIETGTSNKDLIVATATVYALNLTVEKPQVDPFVADWSDYPTLDAIRKNILKH